MPDIADRQLSEQQRAMLYLMLKKHAFSLTDHERAKLMQQFENFAASVAGTAYIAGWTEGRDEMQQQINAELEALPKE